MNFLNVIASDLALMLMGRVSDCKSLHSSFFSSPCKLIVQFGLGWSDGRKSSENWGVTLEIYWFSGALSFLPFSCVNKPGNPPPNAVPMSEWWLPAPPVSLIDRKLFVTGNLTVASFADKVTLSCPLITNQRKMMRCPLSARCQEIMELWAVTKYPRWRSEAMSVVWTRMIIIITIQSGKSSMSVACVWTGTSTTTCAAQATPTRTRVPSTSTTSAMPGLWYFR